MKQKLQFKNVLHLAKELPYFQVNEEGTITLKLDLGYPIIDCHLHLANNYFLAKPVDYWAKHESSRTFFHLHGMPVDLSVYSGVNLAANDKHNHFHFIQTAFNSKIGLMPFHTAANLIREMDEMGVGHAVVLAIDLPFVSKNSQHMLDVYEQEPRLLPFVSLHPLDPRWEKKLEEYLERGARGLKIHPELQAIPIDSKLWKPILKRWAKTGLPILCHSSVSPVQPDVVKGGGTPRSALSRFETMFDDFGGVDVFMGHGGMMEYRDLISLAKKHPNCICEVDGQPPSHLEEFFAQVPHTQLVAGSDWPVYPLALQYAKTFIATEGQEELRHKIFHANAARILGLEVFPMKKKSSTRSKTAVGV